MSHGISLSNESQLYRIRHSLAHILAQAVLEIRPGSKLGFGPPIEDGCYYDFILSSPLLESDIPEIEARMKRIISQGEPFIREELSLAQAIQRIEEMGEPYKSEYAKELSERERFQSLSFYRSGSFLDMCEGPHVDKANDIPMDCFKLKSLAGAYWRGDSSNVMMTRIYAWAFESKQALEEHLAAYELALQRDHKKLGRELEIFAFDNEVGKGLPLWLPNGAVIREELEKLMKELEFKACYQRVVTPHLARGKLYHRTGHLPYYAESMYPAMSLEDNSDDPASPKEPQSYYLRPMNCPHHHKIFASKRRSYRELPLRLAEFGQVYRYEDSGALSGILRVRGMCQNDAHIYCAKEQASAELKNVLQMYHQVYGILGIQGYRFRLSLWDQNDPRGKEKFIDSPVQWEETEAILRQVLQDEGLPFFEAEGEAAFYGPKIDIQLRSVTGREETASTIQLDFGMAERLDLSYIGADNQAHRPYIIHRAPLGTHERMIAFLLEQYGGAFPTWLAPVQVAILPVSVRVNDYALRVMSRLRDQFVRAEVDDLNDTLQRKIRNASERKIPNLLIVGDREANQGHVTLRRRGIKEQVSVGLDEFQLWISERIRARHD